MTKSIFCIFQAYKRQANSVKIAKITAFTIIISSFILGSFILASSYLQAKASCDQVQALDSVLEKELMLETLQQVGKVSYYIYIEIDIPIYTICTIRCASMISCYGSLVSCSYSGPQNYIVG